MHSAGTCSVCCCWFLPPYFSLSGCLCGFFCRPALTHANLLQLHWSCMQIDFSCSDQTSHLLQIRLQKSLALSIQPSNVHRLQCFRRHKPISLRNACTRLAKSRIMPSPNNLSSRCPLRNTVIRLVGSKPSFRLQHNLERTLNIQRL